MGLNLKKRCVVLPQRASETEKFGIKRADKGRITESTFRVLALSLERSSTVLFKLFFKAVFDNKTWEKLEKAEKTNSSKLRQSVEVRIIKNNAVDTILRAPIDLKDAIVIRIKINQITKVPSNSH